MGVRSLHCENKNFFYCFGSCDFDLDPMTFIYELNFPWRHTECAKMNVLYVKDFESYRIKGGECMRLVTRGHFRSRDKEGRYTIRSTVFENPMLYTQI